MNDRLSFISDCITNEGIKFWGYCAFSEIRNKLIDCRAKQRLPEDSKSIVCMLFPYLIDVKDYNISKYAIPPDYHTVILPKLTRISDRLTTKFKGYDFQAFVDASPIPEVDTAVRCSLGVKGNNGLLINSYYGSYVFIGEIVTNMPLPKKGFYMTNHACLRCQKCIQACPAKALGEDTFFKDRCVSNISQKKGTLTDEEQSLLKKSTLIWGCDICQDVCPMNKNAHYTYIDEFKNNAIPFIQAGDYSKLTDRAFQWRKAEVIERNIGLQAF